jgi:hypothetical protein
MSTTGGDNLIIRGRVTGKVIKLRHFEKNGCKWTGFICLNGLRPRLLQPKEGLLPIRKTYLTYEEVVGAGLRTMRVCFYFMFLRAV